MKPRPSSNVSESVVALSQNLKKKEAGGGKTRPTSGGLLPPPPAAKAGGVIPPPGGQQTVPATQPYAGDHSICLSLFQKCGFFLKMGFIC